MSKPASAPTHPTPIFDYQGAGLSLVEVDLKIGPFSFPTYPGLGFGHAIGHETDAGLVRTIVRPARVKASTGDPCSSHVVMGYNQAGVEWDMTFSIETDPGGGMVGCAVALEVDSNYPQTPMTISKATINQPGLGFLVRGLLPKDYLGQLTLKFWGNGRGDIPIDAWALVQVAYVKPEGFGKVFAPGETPVVPVGELVLYPAHQDSMGGVIGDNYPRQVRARARKHG
jgi:hypothetical protein